MALLLLNANAVVSFDHLIDELWEVPPPTARRQVHNAMAALRRSLGGPDEVEIRTTDAGYQLDIRQDQLDAYAFRDHVRDAEQAAAEGHVDDAVRHLCQGLDLWRGPALPGLDSRYIRSAVAGLEEQRLAALERLSSLRLALGEEASVLSDLTRWVAEHPLRESLRASLMLALYRCGRQAEAIEVYDQGRRLLAEQLGLDPGAGLKQLHERILLGTVEPAPAYAPPPPRPAETRAPMVPAEAPAGEDVDRCTLPHDIIDFSGRDAELAQLHEDTARSSPTALMISTIDGMGGIGKTALAVRLAHQLRADYPDGQYFIDLRGFTAGQDPLTPAHALDLLLRDVGVPVERVPAGHEARVGLWRSAMTGRRALLVLDNAVSEEQVRPLLPGAPGTLVIVTSRRHLSSLEGVSPLFLDVLPPDDAAALFRRVAGPDATAADDETGAAGVAEVVDLCGRLPLAIRIAAARLHHRPNWTVADLAERLRDHRRRTRFLAVGDRTVSAVLGLSYRYLRPALRRLFRLLSAHPAADFEAHSVAAMAGITSDEAEQALDELVEDNLVLPGSGGRYKMHDLVRDCAHELAEQHDSAADLHIAVQRLLDYYLHLAWVACRPMARGAYRFDPTITYPPASVPDIDSRADAMSVLKAEHGNLVEVARYAAEHGWLDHAWQIPAALQPFLTQMNYRDNSLEMVTRGLAAARERADQGGEAAMLGSTALILREQGRVDEAEQLFQQAIDISRAIDAPAIEVSQLADLGFTQRRAGRLCRARDTFAAGRRLAERIGDQQGYVTLTNNLAVIYIAMGRYEEAIGYLEDALPVSRETGSGRDEAMVLGNLGWALDSQGRSADGLRHYDRSLALIQSQGSRHAEAMTLAGRSAARLHLGDLAGALADGRAALTVARDANGHYAECEALLAIGDALVASGETAAAESVYDQARQVAASYRFTFLEARGHDSIARLRIRDGDLPEARRLLEQALRMYPHEDVDAAQARRRLAEIAVS
jgi:DNA-binding SARP family transcriptional activator/tetratricopeptide (TPR) repeat protein